jgi:hypothetical protein
MFIYTFKKRNIKNKTSKNIFKNLLSRAKQQQQQPTDRQFDITFRDDEVFQVYANY